MEVLDLKMNYMKGPNAAFRAPCLKSFTAPSVFRLFLGMTFKIFNPS